MKNILVGAAFITTLLLPQHVCSSLIAVVDSGPAPITTEGITGSTRGFMLKPSEDIRVESLGLWDAEGDGLWHSHQVGIWDATTMGILAQTTIGAGTTSVIMGPAVQDGFFRYENIAPVTLLAEQNYVIGAQFFDVGNSNIVDRFLGGNTSATTDPLITITDFQRAHFGSFGFPERSFRGNGFFGPNFTFSAASSVPLISTHLLLLVGLLSLVLYRCADALRT